MSEAREKSEIGFLQCHADILARHFNNMFSNAMLYSGTHPSTLKTASDFFKLIQEFIQGLDSITLIRLRDSFYFEEWCVDKKLNVRRMALHFQKAGLDSITFLKDVKEFEIRELMRIISDVYFFPTVSLMKDEMNKYGLNGIRVNYVSYRKITEDENIVDKSSANIQQGEARETLVIDQDVALSEFGKILDLKNLLEDNKDTSKELSAAMNGLVTDISSGVLREIKNLNSQVNDQLKTGNNYSVEEIIRAIFKLKTDLTSSIETQKSLGRIINAEEFIISEVDKISYKVILHLVKEEYHTGTISAKSIAQLIRRILPDIRELKKFLPGLKETLIGEGMPLEIYLELIRELGKELQNEGLIESFKAASEKLGISVQEIVEAIKKNPESSAKLLLLAAEINQGYNNDEDILTSVLSDYIEKVSSHMILCSGELKDKEAPPVNLIENLITRVESHLISKLRKHGLREGLLQRIEHRLSLRFQETLTRLRTSFIHNLLDHAKMEELASLFEKIIDQETSLENLKDPLKAALEDRGFTQIQIQEFMNKAARIINEKIKHRRHEGVMNKKLLLFLLQHEVNKSIRYKIPLTCIKISINFREKELAAYNHAKIEDLINFIKSIIYEVDILGSTGDYNLLLILPVTDRSGAQRVCEKITNALNEKIFSASSHIHENLLTYQIYPFDCMLTPNFQSYFTHIT